MANAGRRFGVIVVSTLLALAAGCSSAPSEGEATGATSSASMRNCKFAYVNAIGSCTFAESGTLPIDHVCLADLAAATLPDSAVPIGARTDLRIGIVGNTQGASWIALFAPASAPLGDPVAMSAWLHASLPASCVGDPATAPTCFPEAPGGFVATAFDFSSAVFLPDLVSVIGAGSQWHGLFAYDPGGSGGGVGGHGNPGQL